jgi:hypothetical protein
MPPMRRLSPRQGSGNGAQIRRQLPLFFVLSVCRYKFQLCTVPRPGSAGSLWAGCRVLPTQTGRDYF